MDDLLGIQAWIIFMIIVAIVFKIAVLYYYWMRRHRLASILGHSTAANVPPRHHLQSLEANGLFSRTEAPPPTYQQSCSNILDPPPDYVSVITPPAAVVLNQDQHHTTDIQPLLPHQEEVDLSERVFLPQASTTQARNAESPPAYHSLFDLNNNNIDS